MDLHALAADFQAHWLIYVSMPVIAGFIGYLTKVLAIEMVFRPMEFVGIGPIGWQGQLPRRAARFASIGADTLLDNLLDPRELVDRIDPQRVVRELEEPMVQTVDEIAVELLGRYSPVWAELPEPARQLALRRVRDRAPKMVANLLGELRENVDDLFDLRYIVANHLVRNKELLNKLVRETVQPEMRFMVRMGLLFGLGVGLIQMSAWALTHEHWILPLFGLFVGLSSDWIALQMIFAPRVPKRYFGVFRWHGLFFKRREELTRTYAAVGSSDLFNPRVINEALLEGPLSDRVFAMVAREVQQAVDAETGVAQPLVTLAVGSERYRELKRGVVERVQARVRPAAEQLEAYAGEALDVENTVRERMLKMDDDQYEGIFRPIFKDDEWLVVAVGGALGFLVGELQVLLITHLAG
jgi:uncharacterized membrane protein YheB (UPF0754 family)